MRMPLRLASLATLIFLCCKADLSHAIVIDDFESYPNLTSTLVKADPADNLGGWLSSVGGPNTTINQNVGEPPFPILTEGEFNGGERQLIGTTNVSAKAFSGLEAAVSLSFEFRNPSARTYVGFWNDTNNDGLFANSEMGIQFGYQQPSGLSPGFGFRVGNGGSLATSGVAPESNKWYRVTMDIGLLDAGTRDLSLTVRNLTDGVDLDLNGGASGLAFVQNFTNAQIFASETDFVPEGISVRHGASAALMSMLDNISYETGAPSLPGDFNGDGVVDAADYTVYRDNFGGNSNLSGNGNEAGASGGVVDEADYQLWSDSYGATTASNGAAVATPEPAAAMSCLLAIGSGIGLVRGRRAGWSPRL